ncbi:hypothetical protein [Haloparvum sedimenti]|uniref:hypothetical protein n=1 Tax=Haloparvum sedimenti TaxID=1678448 RepID=UPI00071E8776|nr:hypothetical protein [Haloparvum sedimenti]
MSDRGQADPGQLERFLSNREGESGVNPGELRPRHLVAVATTTDDGLASLDEEFDWAGLLEALSELEADEQSRWLRRLVRNLGTRTAAGIESEEGVRALGDRAYGLRHRNPEVFISFLDEVQSLLRYDTSSKGISAAEEEFRRLAEIGDRRSDERVAAFRERDIQQRLVDPNLGADSRISLLRTLGDEPLADVPTRMVVDVLYPLRNHYDAAVEKAALDTYEKWAKQLDDRRTAEEAIELLEDDLAGDLDELPPSMVTGIVMSGYVGPAIVEWLRELPRIESRQEVVVSAFETLEHVSGLRGCADDICSFLLRDAHEDETVHAGIDVLESVLVGLEPRQETETPAQTDHMRGVFFTEAELGVDETVRSTLQTIVESSSYSEAVSAHAASAWLSVRPPEIQRLLWEIDVEDVGESAVADAKLEAAADHRLVEFVDVAADLWDAAEGDADKRLRLVDALDRLESREIVDVLLDPAFDADDEELRRAARETLVDAGYESEVERESQRRTTADRIETRFDAMSTATDIDREIRDRTEERTSTEDERKRAGLEAAEAASKSVDNLSTFRSQGATRMLKLAPLFDRLKELEEAIRELVGRIDSLRGEVQTERDEAKRIEREITSVESDIDAAEGDLDSARREKDDVENRIQELQHDIIPSLEQEVGSLQREFRQLDGKEPSPRDFSGENWREQYERRHDEWERKMGEINREIEKLEGKQNDAETELSNRKSDLRRLNGDISDLEDELRRLRDDHRGLESDLEESLQRIDGYRRELEERQSELREIREEYDRVQARVDDIVGELNGVRQSARSREATLQERGETARSRADSLRGTLRSLAETQSEAVDRRARQAEHVRELAARLDADHDDLADLGERTRAEVPEADVAAVESAERARKHQYRRNETAWRLDSVFRRAVEADRVADVDPELADRAAERVEGGEER